MTVAAVILSATAEGSLADTLGQPRVRRLVDLAWSGGALPAHSVWLDTLLAAVLLGMVWGFRAYVALVPLAFGCLHFGVQTGTVSLPRTRAQWGFCEVGLGFALLGSALLTSWQSRTVGY